MNAFEQIVAKIFEQQDYWIKANVRVELDVKQKLRIMKERTRASIPRPEIDLIAYSPVRNRLLIIETKSYFDSAGVKLSEVSKNYLVPAGSFKLVTCRNYRQIVTKALIQELKDRKLIKSKSTPSVKYILVAGNVHPKNKPDAIDKVRRALKKKGFDFMDIYDIKKKLAEIALNGYEDDVVTMATKIYKDPESLSQ